MQETHARRVDPAGLIIAGLLFALCGVIVWDTLSLQLTATYGVGPKAMPFVIAAGVALLAVGNLVIGLQGEFPERDALNNTAIARIVGGIAALIAVIGYGGGFVVATALLFGFTASAFGRKALHIDLLIGLALATAVYLMFSKLLALALPAGPLEHVLDRLF